MKNFVAVVTDQNVEFKGQKPHQALFFYIHDKDFKVDMHHTMSSEELLKAQDDLCEVLEFVKREINTEFTRGAREETRIEVFVPTVEFIGNPGLYCTGFKEKVCEPFETPSELLKFL